MTPFIVLPAVIFLGFVSAGYLYALLIAFVSWSVEPLIVPWVAVRFFAAVSLVFGWIFAAIHKLDKKEGGQ